MAKDIVNLLKPCMRVICPFYCASQTSRVVYGGASPSSGLYAEESSLCRAALHAGVVSNAGGIVLVAFKPGLPQYGGAQRAAGRRTQLEATAPDAADATQGCCSSTAAAQRADRFPPRLAARAALEQPLCVRPPLAGSTGGYGVVAMPLGPSPGSFQLKPGVSEPPPPAPPPRAPSLPACPSTAPLVA